MNNLVTRNIADNVTFMSIKESRFKTMRISVNAFLPLNIDTAATNALLSLVLTRSCAKYPDFTMLSKKLSSLYGASLSSGFRKMGDTQVLSFNISGIDDRYALDDEVISQQLSDLLCEVIFNPLLDNNEFVSAEVEQERRQLIDMIDADFNEKRIYASHKAISLMCSGEAFGISRYGDKDSVNAVTSAMLYDAWCNMLKTARFEIIYVGESDSTAACEVFSKYFESIDRASAVLSTYVKRSASEVKVENEDMELSQSKMILGFRTDVAEPSEESVAMRLAVAVLGGTAHSKLFCNVREKLSLCYYCSSSYIAQKGIMLVESGVESDNIDKAKNAILNEIEAMKKGDITDEELSSAKLSMCNSYRTTNDTVGGISAFYLSQIFSSKLMSADELCDMIQKVTKEDIINCANKLTLDTVFTLTGTAKAN